MPRQAKHELGQTLMLALQDFQRRLDADLESRGFPGVRQRHRSVFLHLARHGASRSVDLAAAAGIRPQSMMRVVHELEELGLVTRAPDPRDSRAKLVEFTSAGERMMEQLSASTEVVWSQYAGLVGAKQLRQTLDALRELVTASQEQGEI